MIKLKGILRTEEEVIFSEVQAQLQSRQDGTLKTLTGFFKVLSHEPNTKLVENWGKGLKLELENGYYAWITIVGELSMLETDFRFTLANENLNLPAGL